MKLVRRLRRLTRSVVTVALPKRMLIDRGPVRSRCACLTFDDGPDPVHTPALLDVLKRLGIRATFFLIGQKANAYPEIVQRLVNDGHQVGNHSFTHSDPYRTSAREMIDEARQTSQLLSGLTGRPTTLFRPPHGQLTFRKLLALWQAGFTVVLWNTDPKDFARTSSEDVLAWFRQHPVAPGDIVLMHDNHPHVGSVVFALAQELRGRGIGFSTVSEWTGSDSLPWSALDGSSPGDTRP